MAKRKIIKSVRDLPEWFSLENYKGAARLTAIQWRENIEWRLHWVRERDRGNFPNSEVFHQRLRNGYFFQTLDSENQAILQPVRWVLNTGAFSWQYTRTDKPNSYFRSVRTLTEREQMGPLRLPKDREIILNLLDEWEDLHIRQEWAPDENSEGKPTWITPELTAPEQARYENLSEWLDSPVDGHLFWYLRVDPMASDDQLRADFDAWLKELRQREELNKCRKNATDTRFWAWADYQVLAHFDLEFIASLDGIKIQKEVMAEVLFPGKENAESLYKTAVKHKAAAICRETSEALYYQIMGEHREKTENF